MAQKWYQKASVQTAIVSGLFLLIGIAIPYIFKVPALENKIDQLEEENSDKTAEIQRLETQLTPFRTIALEKYTGSEQEALKRLAEELEDLKKYVNPLKKPIASAAAEVEVTIKSDEQVRARYMHEGGYLGFVKDRQFLLLTSNTQSRARQSGKGEVIYKGNFQIQSDHSVIGEPIQILQTADLIQIMFRKIPPNSQVLKGKASVIINGNMRFEFEILPQQMQNDKIIIRDIRNKFLTTQSTGADSAPSGTPSGR
jgi:hypothetical protein